ncbi:MAG: heavy metal translocating P-type ATPase metal-binding domain-containing protein [bacterium]
MNESDRQSAVVCYHCGAPALVTRIDDEGKSFCCAGCKAVYEILSQADLCNYYEFQQNPGITPSIRPAKKFAYLDNPELKRQLVEFSNGELSVINLVIPQMHCSSCIWLLEHLQRLHSGILFSRVDFLKKQLLIRFYEKKISLREVIELLSSLGYEPELNLGSVQSQQKNTIDRSLYLKIGVAAFCFGNIMLFSLPEYLATSQEDLGSRIYFGYLNLVLSIPVVLYSSSIFFSSGFKNLLRGVITIDLPIALGIAIVFLRSAADVLFQTGPGYFDSLTGLVFFLLLGRLFQNKTFDSLNFERKYHSYFPLAAAIKTAEGETTVPLTALRPGQRVIIRNNEIIPADGVVMQGKATIDYSFVTGESEPTTKTIGDLVYAGGKQAGAAVEIELVKEVAESELIQLWSDFGASERTKSHLLTLSNTAGKYFTIAILLIAAVTALYWWLMNPSIILNAVTAILIVSCPCALALAAPFAFGSTMRIFGKKGFYLKQAAVIESLAKVYTIVFDKTGTLTETKRASIRFIGKELTANERSLISSVARCSTHPLSRTISEYFAASPFEVHDFEEVQAAGIAGRVNGSQVRLGTGQWVHVDYSATENEDQPTAVHAAIDNQYLGHFVVSNIYRSGVREVLKNLGDHHAVFLLSGDSSKEEATLRVLYPGFVDMRFRQQPHDKLESIKQLQHDGRTVMMIGDGLNDAGALWQADLGIAVTERSSAFSPACDAILTSASFHQLDRFIHFSTTSLHIVYAAFTLSIVYNIVGLYFAVQGALSPILAAILMPLSSISVVAFSTLITQMLARRKGLL